MVKSYKNFQDEDVAAQVSDRPWRVKNSAGNTPLHVALICSKLRFATMLVEEDPELAFFANNLRETPLHLAIKHHVDGKLSLFFPIF